MLISLLAVTSRAIGGLWDEESVSVNSAASAGAPAHALRSGASATGFGNKRTRADIAAGALPAASDGAAGHVTNRQRLAPVADAEVVTKTDSLKTVGRKQRSPPGSSGTR